MNQQRLLWGAVALLGISVVALLVLLQRVAAGTGSEEVVDPIIATIGGESIREAQLEEALRHKYGPELLSEMLDRRAIALEAEERKLKVEAPEIDAELKTMQQGYDSEEHFYRSMKEQLGMTKAELREDVYYKLMLDKIATAGVVVTDEEVSSYITAHPEEYKTRVQLHLRQIVNQTLEQAKRTLELARGGGDFATLARDRSLDTATANEGGDLGWVEADDPFLPAALLKAAKVLKPGQISEPIALDNGFAVIKLEDRREQTKGSPEQIRESVRKQLALQKAPPLKDIVASLRQKRNAQIADPELKP